MDGWLAGALTRHRGAGWLTVLGLPFVEALGSLSLSDRVSVHQATRGVVLTAGEPTLGDVLRGELPLGIAEVARLLEPVSLSSWSRKGSLSIGGVWFSTASSELPGAFAHHHVTEAFMRRFVDPGGLLGPTPREVGLALVDRLRQSMDEAAVSAWSEGSDLDEIEGFGDLMRALYNGAYHTPDAALRIEALEHAARYPAWTPAQTYNNLLLFYHQAGRIDDALRLMPVALQTAEEAPNSFTFHNAACVLVEAGKLDEAMHCVERAQAHGYPHMDKIQADDDLAPLRSREQWAALFE